MHYMNIPQATDLHQMYMPSFSTYNQHWKPASGRRRLGGTKTFPSLDSLQWVLHVLVSKPDCSGLVWRLCTYIPLSLLSRLSCGISPIYHSQRRLVALKLCSNVSGHTDMTTISILVIIMQQFLFRCPCLFPFPCPCLCPCPRPRPRPPMSGFSTYPSWVPLTRGYWLTAHSMQIVVLHL